MNFVSNIRIFLKKYFPFIYNNTSSLRRVIYLTFFTKKKAINILSTFEEFAPNVSGDEDLKTQNTILNIQNFSKSIRQIQSSEYPLKNIYDEFGSSDRTLGQIFENYGSDKKTHGYDLIYESIFKELKNIDLLIEIGIGSNNEKILSNMSRKGKPGSSLRSFRDYLINSQIIGLEFDSDVLFDEERINTFYFDQNHIESLNLLPNDYLNSVDVLIDDGLHSIIANINSLYFAEKLLKKGGYLIIEDISKYAENIYNVIFHSVKEKFLIDFYTNNSCLVAVLKKI